jgi:hypothetical protein
METVRVNQLELAQQRLKLAKTFILEAHGIMRNDETLNLKTLNVVADLAELLYDVDDKIWDGEGGEE